VRTIEQKRSEFAYNKVSEVKEKAFSKDYKSLVKNFPMMVLKNGLLQTVVFLQAKGKNHHDALLKHIKEYLSHASPLSLHFDDTLSEYLSKIDVAKYINITQDILDFAKWLSRYTEALIEDKQEE